MAKKIDWNASYKPFGTQTVGGRKPKYTSGRDYLQKGMELEKEQEAIKENFQKALPAMEALLKCRMEAKSPIKLVRPLQYTTNEMIHVRDQTYDNNKGEWVDGDVRYSSFQDVVKSLNPGVELILKALDPNLQEFIFEDQNGQEVVLPYSAKNGLMTQTNIYEDTLSFMKLKGE